MSTWRSIKFYIFHLSSYKESDICSLSLELLLNLLASIGIRTDTPKQLACRHRRYIWRFCPCPSAGFLLLYSINYYCMISFSKTKKKTNRHLWEVCLVWVWEQDENRKKGTTERWARKYEDVVREQTGIPFWNVICWFHCGIDAARRHAGQTTDRFYLFLSFSQFNYRSSQTHIAADWHSVWESTSVLCLFVSVPQRVISSTNDLAGSSQMMEITEPSLSKLKQKSQPLHFILFSFPLFCLIYIAPFDIFSINLCELHLQNPDNARQLFNCLSQSLAIFSFRYTFLFLTTVTSLLAFHSSHLRRAIDTLFENRD